ncbi:MAG: type VI secretion system tube protein Hcp, partial [Burkholderiales bacterium]|nr:type VI secretion system tube protein Hcp [Burkholderiales bacterium]
GSNMFLKLTGITGECQEANHKGQIEVMSFSEGLNNLASGSTGMGAGVGRVEYRDFTFTCKLEKAVPNLMSFCADHKPISEAVFTATKMGGSGKSYEYLQITLKNARVSHVEISGSANSEPHVSVSLNFEEIKTEYWEETPTGGKGASVSAAWNNKENRRV